MNPKRIYDPRPGDRLTPTEEMQLFRRQLQTTASGLSLVVLGVACGYLSSLLSVFVVPERAWRVELFSPDTLTCICGIGTILGTVLVLVGRIRCCGCPPDTGRKLAVWAWRTTLLYDCGVLALIFFRLALSRFVNNFDTQAILIGFVVCGIGIVAVGVAAEIVFLHFLAKLGEDFEDNSLYYQALFFLRVSYLLSALFVVGFVVLVGFAPDYIRSMFLVYSLGLIIAVIGMCLWYIAIVFRAREVAIRAANEP